MLTGNDGFWIFSPYRSHQQALKEGYLDAATVEGEQMVTLHLVEDAADVKAAVVELGGYLLHEDVEGLGTGGVETAGEKEASQPLAERAGGGAPGMVT